MQSYSANLITNRYTSENRNGAKSWEVKGDVINIKTKNKKTRFYAFELAAAVCVSTYIDIA